MIRSIICASPGIWNDCKNSLKDFSNDFPLKSNKETNSFKISTFLWSGEPIISPTCAASNEGVSRINEAIEYGVSWQNPFLSYYWIPFFHDILNM